jgi:hypothetical protein
MKNLIFILAIILLFSCIQYDSNENKPAMSSARITDKIINERFGGVGFDVFDHMHNASRWQYEQIFAKRWRELNPSFARVPDDCGWDFKKIDKVSWFIDVLKETNTEIYITTFRNNCLKKNRNEKEYVKHETDNLEYLIKEKGFDKIKYYCMANELSLTEWASMTKDLEFYKKVQGMFYDEFKERNLDIKLLATDASPFEYWNTIKWASENMDDITGVYGGHHYINSYDLFDNTFYSFFLNKMKWGAELAASKNKRFIVGEFGAKQNSNIIDSVMHDANMYNHTPLEKYMGIQVSEAILAMINAGIYSCGYWTFSDFPFSFDRHRTNKWGLYHWEIDNYTTKPSYYCLGLITKFFRGPAEAYEVTSSDTLLRMAAIRNLETGSISVAVINRHEKARQLSLEIQQGKNDRPFRKYLYDPQNVPFNYFGDLQSYTRKITAEKGSLVDTIPPQALVIYTTACDDDPPEVVKGLKWERKKIDDRDRAVLTWEPNTEKDFCYYRIYRSPETEVEISPRWQIASTISNKYIDMSVHNLPEYNYRVIAVDQSGNSSK